MDIAAPITARTNNILADLLSEATNRLCLNKYEHYKTFVLQ